MLADEIHKYSYRKEIIEQDDSSLEESTLPWLFINSDDEPVDLLADFSTVGKARNLLRSRI